MYAAKALGSAPGIDVTLIDRRNFHLFQPLLYQVATAGLSPGEIASPLRAVLRKHQEHHRPDGRGDRVRPRRAAGAADRRRGALRHPDRRDRQPRTPTSATTSGKRLAPGLKTIEDALDIRRRIFLAFEQAEREPDPEEAQGAG